MQLALDPEQHRQGKLPCHVAGIKTTLLYGNTLLYSTRNLMSANNESKPAKTGKINELIDPNARSLRLAGWLIELFR